MSGWDDPKVLERVREAHRDQEYMRSRHAARESLIDAAMEEINTNPEARKKFLDDGVFPEELETLAHVALATTLLCILLHSTRFIVKRLLLFVGSDTTDRLSRAVPLLLHRGVVILGIAMSFLLETYDAQTAKSKIPSPSKLFKEVLVFEVAYHVFDGFAMLGDKQLFVTPEKGTVSHIMGTVLPMMWLSNYAPIDLDIPLSTGRYLALGLVGGSAMDILCEGIWNLIKHKNKPSIFVVLALPVVMFGHLASIGSVVWSAMYVWDRLGIVASVLLLGGARLFVFVCFITDLSKWVEVRKQKIKKTAEEEEGKEKKKEE